MAFGHESFTELLEAWDGRAVVVRYDVPTGTWIFVALHDDTLGRPVGGCRMKVYPRPEEGLRDALRLAEGMTHKWAAIDLPYGGGKSVLAIPRPLEGAARRGLLRRFGGLLRTLRGAYGTGEDLGTTPQDIRTIARVAPDAVVGLPPEGSDGPIDPGPYTALGVFAGVKAAVRHRFGSDDLSSRTVLIQGVGDVGEPLARLVTGAGARVLLSDIDQDKAFALAVEVGATTVITPEDVYETDCDVYAPCAVGATLNAGTIPRLRCGVVAGSANNQLETPEDAGRLLERGILYAPDYVINAGGAMAFGLIALGAEQGEALEARVEGIGASLAEIFEEAGEAGDSPLAAARRRVDRVLERARKEGSGGQAAG
ncbi:MAG: Glu/Leu/Phe/Val dehydrogenase dimerization domain-containing protein [Longimicrobiales bacterium]